MKYDIVPLPEERWKGHLLPFAYTSQHCYDAEITQSDGLFSARFVKKPLETPFVYDMEEDDFPDALYADWWDGAEAFGVLVGDELVACIEIWREEWSKRLRVTELWVAEDYRRQGIGAALMSLAKQRARELHCRAVMLETQTNNEKAIAFYLSQGFSFFGFDRSAYGNRDVDNRKVRLELGVYLEET
jgi:ribosomal protein S18 acetylase RimI-like enzyme